MRAAVGAAVATGAIALALFAADAFHSPLVSPLARPPVETQAGHSGESLIRGLGCGGCHAGVPAPAGPIALPLVEKDPTRDPGATFVYMRDEGGAARPGSARMPSFHLDDAEALALALHLAGGRAASGDARTRFNAARRAHRDVTAADGARIFDALNCVGCHVGPATAWRVNGPPLAGVGSRLRPEALREFLVRPTAVRPFGFRPGSGARMPDFALTAAEADSIVAYLDTLRMTPPLPEAGSTALSPFAAMKARTLMVEKLSCLGCHALNGRGGHIAPDLARAGERLRPGYLRAIIDDPARAMPGTIMPRAPLSAGTRDLIVAFLAQGDDSSTYEQQTAGGGGSERARRRGGTSGLAVAGGEGRGAVEAPDRSGYLSLIDHVTIQFGPRGIAADPAVDDSSKAASLYAYMCAACHGTRGRGDGFNARYLRVPPAAHASANAMSRRPDDTLFDGIHAGGAILGGSPEMPAFGESLSPSEIAGLVDYIRKLCDCRQPAWADDGQ